MGQDVVRRQLGQPVRVETPVCEVCGGQMLSRGSRGENLRVRYRCCDQCGNTGKEVIRRIER